jgi:hypothetical protein
MSVKRAFILSCPSAKLWELLVERYWKAILDNWIERVQLPEKYKENYDVSNESPLSTTILMNYNLNSHRDKLFFY